MSNQPHTITTYETLFAIRTGLTILLPKVAAFDGCEKSPPVFSVNAGDVVITANGQTVILKKLAKNLLDASVTKGFIMFYEMNGEDFVRNTLCSYKA